MTVCRFITSIFVFAGAVTAVAADNCVKQKLEASFEASPFQRVANTIKLHKGSLLKDIDPASYAIFEQVRLNPEKHLSDMELTTLRDKGLEGVFTQWRQTGYLIKKLNKEIADLHRSRINKANDKFILKSTKWVGKAAFPFYRLFQFDFRSRAIAKKILADPFYALSEKESAYLVKTKRFKDMERFRADAENGLREKFVRINQLRRVGDTLVWSVTIPGVAMGLVGNKYISSKQSMNENDPDGMSKYDDKVELIFLSPMSHASIRIGGIVYNYGVMNIERWNLEEFGKTVGFGQAASGNHTRIELKLTPEEKEKLRDYLEEDVGKIYPLFPPFVDCVSQTNNAVKYATGIAVPPIANRSQSLTIAYWKLRKFLGSDKTGDIRFASQGSPLAGKAADAAVNTLDGLMFMRYGPEMLAVTPVSDQFKLTVDPKTGKIQ